MNRPSAGKPGGYSPQALSALQGSGCDLSGRNSITVRSSTPNAPPKISLTDESRRVVCSRPDNFLRVAGTAELNGFDLSPNPGRSAAWCAGWRTFPGAADLGQVEHWCGLRPSAPTTCR